MSTYLLVFALVILQQSPSLPLSTAQPSQPSVSAAASMPTYKLDDGLLTSADQKSGEIGSIKADRVHPPKLTHTANPHVSKKEWTDGICRLRVDIGSDGKPHNIVVVDSLTSTTDMAATQAVEKYRFHPATLDDQSIAMQIMIEMRFQLRHR